MGATPSVHLSNQYRIRGWPDVKVDGGKSALARKVRQGTRFEVWMEFQMRDPDTDEAMDTIPKHIERYFSTVTFARDVEQSITYRYTGAPRAFEIPVPNDVIETCVWKRSSAKTGMRRVGGTPIAFFELEIVSQAEHLWPDVVAYVASCMAWHIRHGSIPVHGKNSVSVECIRFRIPKKCGAHGQR